MAHPERQHLILVAVCALSFCAGVAVALVYAEKMPGVSAELRESGSYTYISPLLSCSEGPSLLPQAVQETEEAVERIIKDHEDRGGVAEVAVYYRDLNNGPWFGINEDIIFVPGSLLKVPMMMAYLKLLERDPAAAAAEIPYERKQSQAVQGTVIAHPLVVGEHYAPNTLLERMITESDNESAYLLYRFVGDELAGEVYTELGLPVPFANQDYNVRVRDYATFFRILYNATYLSPESSERALELLTRSDFDKGISAGIPAGIPIANKFGERDYGRAGDSQLHDCGIVYAPKRPYMLCIMTQGSGIERLSEVIRDISAAVYEHSITY